MRTLVYGLGSSGVAVARTLALRGEPVLVADGGDDGRLRATLAELDLPGVLGAGPEVLEGVDRVVVSPGISPGNTVLQTAEAQGIPVIPEVGFGLGLLGDGVRVAAITGTNGKTTVVDMIHRMLLASGVPHAVAGNSWTTLTSCLDAVRDAGTLVLELSSFQLHFLESPGFEVAGLLNVKADHLNWHASFEEYASDKLRIFDGQRSEDLALLGSGEPVGLGVEQDLKAGVLVVGRDDTGVRDGSLSLRGSALARVDELPFAGTHNYENALFAAAAAERLGADPDAIRGALLDYGAMPHRLEVVARLDAVTYVDDSKATNPAAVAAALESFEEPVVLILGGSEKYTEFSELLPGLPGCRAVVCQGEAGPRIAAYLEDEGWRDIVYRAPDLGRAVETAGGLARDGDVVLLSPGCASFDQYAGYAERGDAFATFAREFAGSHRVAGR